MIQIKIKGSKATLISPKGIDLPSGSDNYVPVQIIVDETDTEWAFTVTRSLTFTALTTRGARKTVPVALPVNYTAKIPYSVISTPLSKLSVGVIGRCADGSQITTNMVNLTVVSFGADGDYLRDSEQETQMLKDDWIAFFNDLSHDYFVSTSELEDIVESAIAQAFRTLPAATADNLGLVKIGENISVDEDGKISVADPFGGSFSDLTGIPTTLEGYGITDAYTKTEVDTLIAGTIKILEENQHGYSNYSVSQLKEFHTNNKLVIYQDCVLVYSSETTNSIVYYFFDVKTSKQKKLTGSGSSFATISLVNLLEYASNNQGINGTVKTINQWLSQFATDIAAKYTKPANGIPATDLEAGVIPDISGKQDKSLAQAIAGASTVEGALSALATDKADLVNGTVPAAQLPSYVDDVLEVADYASLPSTGESGKIYVTLDDNKTYRWSGSAYVQLAGGLVLGETESTAYRGDRGKTAYDHSQATGTNPHGVTYAQLPDQPTIPSKTSQLQNDSGFLTQHQDISGKQDKALATSVESESTVEGALGALSTNKQAKSLTSSVESESTVEGALGALSTNKQAKTLASSIAGESTVEGALGALSSQKVNLTDCNQTVSSSNKVATMADITSAITGVLAQSFPVSNGGGE